jgi:diguanylate cyclase (GGDEF)-like protein/PAS domain S-box-containing protein
MPTKSLTEPEIASLLYRGIDNSHFLCLITDLQGKILYANKGALEILNYKADELYGKYVFSILSNPPDLQGILKNQKVYDGFVEGRTKLGLPVYLRLEIKPLLKDKKEMGFIYLGGNLSEKRELQGLEIVSFDTLTGIPHKASFSSWVNAYIEWVNAYIERYKAPFTLLIVDIYGLRTLAITYELHFIETLLKEVSQRLKAILPSNSFIGRTEADEFLIVLFETTKEQVGNLIMNIFECFYHPFLIDERPVLLTVNIGISSYPEDGKTFEELFRKAIFALETAKKKGENTFSIYETNL